MGEVERVSLSFMVMVHFEKNKNYGFWFMVGVSGRKEDRLESILKRVRSKASIFCPMLCSVLFVFGMVISVDLSGGQKKLNNNQMETLKLMEKAHEIATQFDGMPLPEAKFIIGNVLNMLDSQAVVKADLLDGLKSNPSYFADASQKTEIRVSEEGVHTVQELYIDPGVELWQQKKEVYAIPLKTLFHDKEG